MPALGFSVQTPLRQRRFDIGIEWGMIFSFENERRTISVGRVYFRGKAIIVANPEGVHLSLLPYLRPFHPPLFIPWKDLDRRGGHTDQVVFDVGAPPIAEIRIPLKVVEEAQSS